ncbi:hypothetical protein Q9S78_02430 [Microbacterium sp. KSW-18]|uniref:Uncharacterized protein n=1 Tax=Microbacterium aquilitoris TaxID=3067307 RepID=A0ABU3GFP3_9MICO|nr:hypothetical protein [Microbacterium sp. KSW-18]MDT3329517.1 hypothetical protein [Microbacterium sp. KSW-18]
MVHEEVAVFVDLSRGIHVSQGRRTHANVAPARTVECEQLVRISRSHRFPHQAVVARSEGQLWKGLQAEASVLAPVRRGAGVLEPDLCGHLNPEHRRTLRRLSWMRAALLRMPGVRARGRAARRPLRGVR